jgi:hypothetical protein
MTTAVVESLRDEENVPQYGLGMILFMYAWPVAWFMFLIYVIGPAFVRRRNYPLWGYNLADPHRRVRGPMDSVRDTRSRGT